MEDELFRRRLLDLASQSDRAARFTFTDFLTEAEQAAFWAVRSQLPPCGYTLSGGREDADRVMIRFGDPEQLGYEEPFPIVCVRIAPKNDRFAEALTHRDVLGAVMHLGIERGETGDILISGKDAFLFCKPQMAEYIIRSLDRVRHTSVTCSLTEDIPAEITEQREEVSVQCASERLDLVVAKLYHMSRGDVKTLLAAGKVFVAGVLTEQGDRTLHTGERVSVRGYGKFRYLGQSGTTKKGNLILRCEKYV